MAHKPVARGAVILTGLSACTLLLSACAAGQKASYSYKSAQEVDIELIPITPAYIQQQQAVQLPAAPGMQSPEGLTRDPVYRYRIGPADVLVISVPTIVSFNAQNSSGVLGEQGQLYTVYDDGTVYLPFAGSVVVGGLTLREAQSEVVDALTRYLRSPQVVVGVKEFRSQRVMVTGQVQQPGYLPISDVPMTVIGALSAAGGIADLRGRRDPRQIGQGSSAVGAQGLAEFPDLGRVALKRAGETYRIDVSSILAAGNTDQDVQLKDGDVLVVPAIKRTNVIVMGEVLRPALLEVTVNDTDLAEVLLATGGLNQSTANARRVYVIRGDFNRPTVYQIDARAPDAMLLAQKFRVAPRDVIYVAEAPIARFNRTLQQILPTVQGLLSTAVIVNTVDDVSDNN